MCYVHEVVIDDVCKVVSWKTIGLYQDLHINTDIITASKQDNRCRKGFQLPRITVGLFWSNGTTTLGWWISFLRKTFLK